MAVHALDAAAPLLSSDELRARLLAIGPERYHHRHPFHLRMHEGQLTRGQLQAWALNRYYYQSRIPLKDAIILSRSEDKEFRKAWRKRIVDHDGDAHNAGGIERWVKLAEASGLDPTQLERGEGILPATRYAVNEYLRIVRDRTFLEAVASSLTELSGGLDYFEARLTQAPADAAFAIQYVQQNAKTGAQQELAIQALRDKCDILWAQLDALYYAYVQPGWPPPGAFQIEGA